MENGANLLDVMTPELQAAARLQMQENGAQYAWLGGIAKYENPPGPWRWLNDCKGFYILLLFSFVFE